MEKNQQDGISQELINHHIRWLKGLTVIFLCLMLSHYVVQYKYQETPQPPANVFRGPDPLQELSIYGVFLDEIKNDPHLYARPTFTGSFQRNKEYAIYVNGNLYGVYRTNVDGLLQLSERMSFPENTYTFEFRVPLNIAVHANPEGNFSPVLDTLTVTWDKSRISPYYKNYFTRDSNSHHMGLFSAVLPVFCLEGMLYV